MQESPVQRSTETATRFTETQRRILSYLRDQARTQTYFKSGAVGEELGLSANEVGTNIAALREQTTEVDIEKWGYSSSTTWKVTL